MVLLAQAFAERFAKKMGRNVGTLTESSKRRLLATTGLETCASSPT